MFTSSEDVFITKVSSFICHILTDASISATFYADKHREVHRFDRNTFAWSIKSIEVVDEYASSPPIRTSEIAQYNPAIIHYTPHYLYAPTVPFEMSRFYPHAQELKFLVMLRNPIERAISSYWFQNSHIFKGTNEGMG
jgi:hypothetical protein